MPLQMLNVLCFYTILESANSIEYAKSSISTTSTTSTLSTISNVPSRSTKSANITRFGHMHSQTNMYPICPNAVIIVDPFCSRYIFLHLSCSFHELE